MEEPTHHHLRLILFPSPLQGHINPMLQLAHILHSNSFSITILHTKLNSPDPSHHPHFTFLALDDGLSQTESSMEEDIIELTRLINVKCVDPLRASLRKLLDDQQVSGTGERIACLISDAALYATREVAESVKLRRIVLRTGGVSSFVIFKEIPMLLEKGYLPIQESRLDEPIPEIEGFRVRDLPAIKTASVEKFYQLLTSMVEETKASSGLIWNSFEELEHSALDTLCQEFSLPIFLMGPFQKYSAASSDGVRTPDQSSIAWLDKQEPKSVIYVSFGSVAAIDANQFLEIATGLANSNHPFLWVVRPDLVRGLDSECHELLPDGYIEMLGGRGHIVKWAPQQEVLKHPAVGAFWTHNGWNSTLESICGGVPMICMPFFSDQVINARYVSHIWKIGVQLEGRVEREKIVEIIKRLMTGNEGEEIRKTMSQFKEKVQVCTSAGGSSHNALQNLISFIATSSPLDLERIT
ncbi:hypothetical protein Leryth_020016 [Lithospermum erythrorhizon]|nr:hypothetical protein Leryth_020016 [Lithospermum erythrorhizon]